MKTTRILEQEARFLAADRATHRAVADVRSLDGFQVVQRRRERQRNTYFDTPDLRLRAHRAVLKVRAVGRRRELTFKQSRGYRDGVATRLELTTRIQAGHEARLRRGHVEPTAEPARRAQALIKHQALRFTFSMLTDRRILVMARDDERIEIDVDHVVLRRARKIRASRLEVEVENLTASPRAFRHFLTALQQRFPVGLRRCSVSKYEFGFRMSGGQGRAVLYQ